MKYVTRPAPPPPGAVSSSMAPSNITSISSQMAKPKPPRPPPPRAMPSTDKTSSKDQPMKIFSNLFGGRKAKNNDLKASSQNNMEVKLPPPRIPAPPAVAFASKQPPNTHHHHQQQPVYTSDVQLINFNDSPPSSPVGFIKKSNTGGSDSVSIDSFCSTNSSPHNFNSGTQSQAESGFEDDFNSVSDFKLTSRAVSRSTTFSNDPFECLDDFSATTSSSIAGSASVKNTVNIRNIKPMIQPKPVSIGSTNFYSTTATASSSSIAPSPLNFGDDVTKNVKPSMPTIIKPSSMITRKPSPIHVPSPTPSVLNELKKPIIGASSNYKELDATSDESFEDEPPSPPMPTIPAPVLVLNDEVAGNVVEENEDDDDEEKDSYGIALYDFESDVTEDLNFRANEKIYLIKQMNEEWMYGRNRRGCEGIFPVNYIDVRVPLKNSHHPELIDSGTASRSESVSPAAGHRVRVLYSFNAEAEGDLTINENEFVNVMYEINGEWLYGSNMTGEYGQFPANFLEFVPQNLQPMPKY